MAEFTEPELLEKATLDCFKELGYEVAYGPDISPGGPRPERGSYSDVLLLRRLRASLTRINPTLPSEAIDKAIHELIHIAEPTLEKTNRKFHFMLRDGVRVEVNREGRRVWEIVKIFDFDDPANNDWLAVNQFSVVETGKSPRRPDIVVFVNGIPLAIIELKVKDFIEAYNKIQNYKNDIPTIFYYNEVVLLATEREGRIGTFTTPRERFVPWRTVKGQEQKGVKAAITGVFNKETFLELIRDFVIYEVVPKFSKIIARDYQYDAVKEAIKRTLKAYSSNDKRIGVVFHAQGVGKSLEMVFYVMKLLRLRELENPTVLILTDRNDLDDQIYEKFCAIDSEHGLSPIQAETVEHLKELLKTPAGGVIFSTVQKFRAEDGHFPLLSERNNIVVIADEAHRSHYNFISGYARYIREALPNAMFVGFTATPIELGDRSTTQVFGDHIHVLDLSEATKIGATVPVVYENRWAKIGLDDHSKEILDEAFEEVTENEEVEVKEKLKEKWSRLEAVLGSESVLRKLAEDVVKHFEERDRIVEGKAIIACASRRIAIELYNQIIKLRPEWHSDDDDKGFIKVLITGSTNDPPEWQPHIRNKPRRKELKDRFADPNSPPKIMIVRDMLLTGFDCPCLHTLYIYKPMKGHTLLQAVERVNRPYKDKPAGLIVDYIGIGEALAIAIKQYTKETQKDLSQALPNEEEVIKLIYERYREIQSMLKGLDYTNWRKLSKEGLIELLCAAQDRVSVNDEIKKRFIKAVDEMKKAFSLFPTNPEVFKLRDDLMFFEAVKKRIIALSPGAMPSLEVESSIKELVSEAVVLEDIKPLLEKGKIDILDKKFLEQVEELKFPNIRVEIMRRLLTDRIAVKVKRNPLRFSSFKERLEKTIRDYYARAISSAQVMEELIKIARELRESEIEGEKLGLTEEELAFYDALAQGKEYLASNEQLKELAKKVVNAIKRNLSIDWTYHESVKAKIRSEVKKVLRASGVSPARYQSTVDLVMKQAEALYKEWPTIQGPYSIEVLGEQNISLESVF
ncbi:MAG: type I restriction endonuclease subunit R [Acidilobus sp.]|jgi:type I restriction enzyme R subunit